MKNIHVLPTEKPSRLVKLKMFGKDKLHLCKVVLPIENEEQYQNIYITSDEEIEEGDWYYLPRTNSVYKCNEDPTELNLERRLGVAKIILTTDPDLIGVQAIDDEFLEWFVKNPSCEEVEVQDMSMQYHEEGYYEYKIIIPQEEPKQENCCTPVGQIKRYVNCIGCDKKPKQETLEDFIRRESKSGNESVGILKGVIWQAERMYSEEEAKTIWKAGQEYWKTSGASITFEELTEQFKKK